MKNKKSKRLPENPKLRDYREWKELTQKELAKKTKIPLSSIQYYEYQQQIPRLDKAVAIAAALEISLEDLAKSLGIDCSELPPKKN